MKVVSDFCTNANNYQKIDGWFGSSDYNAQFTGINVAIAYLLLVVLFKQGLFRPGESTSGSSQERRIGMPYTLSTWMLAAGFPRWPQVMPVWRTPPRALLWAVNLARMVGKLPCQKSLSSCN